jgi:hypothetical protein
MVLQIERANRYWPTSMLRQATEAEQKSGPGLLNEVRSSEDLGEAIGTDQKDEQRHDMTKVARRTAMAPLFARPASNRRIAKSMRSVLDTPRETTLEMSALHREVIPILAFDE